VHVPVDTFKPTTQWLERVSAQRSASKKKLAAVSGGMPAVTAPSSSYGASVATSVPSNGVVSETDADLETEIGPMGFPTTYFTLLAPSFPALPDYVKPINQDGTIPPGAKYVVVPTQTSLMLCLVASGPGSTWMHFPPVDAKIAEQPAPVPADASLLAAASPDSQTTAQPSLVSFPGRGPMLVPIGTLQAHTSKHHPEVPVFRDDWAAGVAGAGPDLYSYKPQTPSAQRPAVVVSRRPVVSALPPVSPTQSSAEGDQPLGTGVGAVLGVGRIRATSPILSNPPSGPSSRKSSIHLLAEASDQLDEFLRSTTSTAAASTVLVNAATSPFLTMHSLSSLDGVGDSIAIELVGEEMVAARNSPVHDLEEGIDE
jgi:hypothetical protein